MQFGKVKDPVEIDFSLPEDNPDTKKVLGSKKSNPDIYIGCTGWSRSDLKNFYPKGIKDELAYYATKFNTIELNATFYTIFQQNTIESWYEKTPENFRFCPKVYQEISHRKRLKDVKTLTDVYLDGIALLREKLGCLFLQMPENFGPESWQVLKKYLEEWSSGFPLALELRHPAWYNGSWNNSELYTLLEKQNIAHVITDSPGRRDLLHMRLTTTTAFIRFNSTNLDSDYPRLDDWFERIKLWVNEGIENIYFFVHQDHERVFPDRFVYLIKKMNSELGINLNIPHNPMATGQLDLFG